MSEFYLNERLMQQRVAEEHRQAELRRLQEEVGTGRTSWLVRQRYRILCWLGRILVSSGRQLLQSTSQPPPAAEGPSDRRS